MPAQAVLERAGKGVQPQMIIIEQVGSIDALYDWERDRERVSQTWAVLNGSVQAPSE